MELWIRSQSKETLVKVNEVYINEAKIKANYKGYYGGCDYRILGEYKTEERALEVLDDIESLLCGNTRDAGLVKGIGVNSKNAQNLIYEMPKE